MANRYFAGNSLAAFKRTTNAIVEATTSGYFDSAYVAAGIALSTSTTTDYIEAPQISATGTIWLRWTFRNSANSASNALWLEMNNGATGVFRLRNTGNNLTRQPEYWNGSAWTTTGTAWTGSPSALVVLALKITLNSGFELYANGTLVASGSGWSGSPTTLTTVRLYGANAGTHIVSEIMCADYDLRDSHFMAAALNGNSATNTGAAAGVYTDVNETVLDDSTAISVTSSGNKAGQTHASITVPGGYNIASMVQCARGRAAGSITDGKLGIRVSSTNYSSSGLSFATGYEPRVVITENNPATSARFTQTEFNNAEVYLEAV